MLALRVSKVAVDSYFIGQSLVIEIHQKLSQKVSFIRHYNCYESSRINKIRTLQLHWVITEKDLL